MKRLESFVVLLMCLCWFLVGSGLARAEDLSGTFSTTMTIIGDSQLVGDVTCTVVGAPCIAFGASNIKLRLNGFTITGRAVPPANCVSGSNFASAPEDGVSSAGQSQIAILGPGLVEGFGRNGIFLVNSSQVRVDTVTVANNCFSGIFLSGTSYSDIEQTVSVRNLASAGFTCGGT